MKEIARIKRYLNSKELEKPFHIEDLVLLYADKQEKPMAIARTSPNGRATVYHIVLTLTWDEFNELYLKAKLCNGE